MRRTSQQSLPNNRAHQASRDCQDDLDIAPIGGLIAQLSASGLACSFAYSYSWLLSFVGSWPLVAPSGGLSAAARLALVAAVDCSHVGLVDLLAKVAAAAVVGWAVAVFVVEVVALVSIGTVGVECWVPENARFASAALRVFAVLLAHAPRLGELVVVLTFVVAAGLVACYEAAVAVVAAAVAAVVVAAVAVVAAAADALVAASSGFAAAWECSSHSLERSLSSAPIELD